MQPHLLIEAIRQFVFNERGSFPFSGNSMRPFFQNGQTVETVPFSGILRIGKCYIFVLSNSTVLHRLIFLTRKNAWFIGDNGFGFQIVPRKNIVAEITREDYNSIIIFMILLANWLYYFIPGKNRLRFIGVFRIKWISFWTKERLHHERTV
jgi:hypothetical protein